jgi:AhpD family alkylhydroperoxidase
MDDNRCANTRFDPNFVAFHGIAKEMAISVGYTVDMFVDAKRAQLLRLRVAQMNACCYCLILHTISAHNQHNQDNQDNQDIHPAKVAHLANWLLSTLFSPAEQVVLAYCEGLMDYDLAGFEPFHQTMTDHFSDTEIAAIVINMNLWARLQLTQSTTPIQES